MASLSSCRQSNLFVIAQWIIWLWRQWPQSTGTRTSKKFRDTSCTANVVSQYWYHWYFASDSICWSRFPTCKRYLRARHRLDIGNIRLLIVKSAMQTSRDLVDTVLAVDIHSSINITKTPLTSTSCVAAWACVAGSSWLKNISLGRAEPIYLSRGKRNLGLVFVPRPFCWLTFTRDIDTFCSKTTITSKYWKKPESFNLPEASRHRSRPDPWLRYWTTGNHSLGPKRWSHCHAPRRTSSGHVQYLEYPAQRQCRRQTDSPTLKN